MRFHWVAAAAVGLAVWALRVAVVGDLGTGIPYWDQWDREGLVIYEPLIEGRLSWRAIFEPHLEHRIVWTHLWNLALLKLCGQWDPMVQMVTQAVFPALTAGCCVWGLLGVRLERIWRCAVVVGALVAFGFPFADGNILWGFQSQFGLLVAFSLGLCASAGLAWENSSFAWLALIAGLASPLAMGAGALAGPVIVVLVLVVIAAERKFTRRSAVMLAIGLICFLWGMLLRSNSTVMAFARAESVATFLVVWFRTLAWPNCQIPWLAMLGCLPVGVLTIQVMRRKALPRPHELFIIGIAVWAVGCAAGGAWTRGGVDRVPPSRYYDFLAPLSWVNLLALVLVAGDWWTQGTRRWRILGLLFAIAWLGPALGGGTKLMTDFFRATRPAWQEVAGRQFEAVNGVLGGAPISVMTAAGLHPSSAVLEKVMGSPSMASFLPPELQSPPGNSSPDGSLAIGLPGPHGDWRWLSGQFDEEMSAMMVFVRGDAGGLQLALLTRDGTSQDYFRPSGRHIGPWSEWLVRAAPGQRQFSIQAAPASGELTIVFPRPLSALGYWARCGAAKWEWLLGAAGLCLVIALLASGAGVRGAKPDRN